MANSWERAAAVKNYLRMRGLQQRGSAIPSALKAIHGELERNLEEAKRDYPLEFASEVEICMGDDVVWQMELEAAEALEDRSERIWVLLNDYTKNGDRLRLDARELVSFRRLQRHVGNPRRNGTSIDSKRIIFYFAHLPVKGIWTLVHSHVDAAPFPTGSDISYLPLGWLGLTASVYRNRFYIIPFRADSFEYRGKEPTREQFGVFVLSIKRERHRGWYEGKLYTKDELTP
ncbi:MAG: hypothetical protein ACUVV6_07245 [Thermoplasmatota archaeon]